MNWTKILRKECDKVEIDYFTSPYSLELVEHVNKYVQAYKIGSGDITWLEIIKHIAKKKPVILASEHQVLLIQKELWIAFKI